MNGNKKEIDFEALAELSKLQFSDFDKDAVKKELREFLCLINKLEEIDRSAESVSDYEPPKVNAFREDVIGAAKYSSDEMLSNAKTKCDGYITVPRVVEGTDND